jgi:hypothetical protein
MRHTHDLQDHLIRRAVSAPPPFGHLLGGPRSAASRVAANANADANDDPDANDDDANANADTSTTGDEVEVDLDTDLDVDMDIQIDDSSDASAKVTDAGDAPAKVTDAVRTDRRAWSSVPKIATPPATPEAPSCPLRDRRSSYRHGVSLPIELIVPGASGPERHAAQTRMLSFGGAFIESSLRPAFASRVALAFRVPGHDLTIEVIGVVRWSDGRGFGVQFGGLRAHAIWALGKYFSNL